MEPKPGREQGARFVSRRAFESMLAEPTPAAQFVRRYYEECMTPLQLVGADGAIHTFPSTREKVQGRALHLLRWLQGAFEESEKDAAFARGVTLEIVAKDMLQNFVSEYIPGSSLLVRNTPSSLDESTSTQRGGDIIVTKPHDEHGVHIPVLIIDIGSGASSRSKGTQGANVQLATPVITFPFGQMVKEDATWRDLLESLVKPAINEGRYKETVEEELRDSLYWGNMFIILPYRLELLGNTLEDTATQAKIAELSTLLLDARKNWAKLFGDSVEITEEQIARILIYLLAEESD